MERPPRDLDVPPAPLRGSRGRRRDAAFAVVIGAAVIVAAVAVAQVAPPEPVAPAPSIPGVPGTSVPTHGSSAGAVEIGRVAIPRRLGRAELAAAVRDGTLDGRLVFVDGTLDADPRRCQGLAEGYRGCVDLAIPGLGLPVWAGEVAVPWPGAPPPGAWLVTVARTGGLVYLGSLVPWLDGPRSIGELGRRFAGGGDDVPGGTLYEADGFLVIDPVHACLTRDTAATPCPAPSPFLADARPLDDGILVSDAGAEVRLAGSVPEVDPADVVTAGTFLVAPLDEGGARWQVVARYEPSRSVRVQVP
jgi:hypothetical protein